MLLNVNRCGLKYMMTREQMLLWVYVISVHWYQNRNLKKMFKAIKHAAESRCLILGDFNYPNIDWDSWECNKDNKELVDVIQDNFLFQHVKVIIIIMITDLYSAFRSEDTEALEAAQED